MHWYDYGAILCALILALFAGHSAEIALRASIVMYFLKVVPTEWVRGYDLRELFGPLVYSYLRRLVDAGIIERREEPGGPKRGFRPDYFYRRRDTAVSTRGQAQ